MTSSPSLAESTTLPSFDQLLASLSQPELRQSSAPLDRARPGQYPISSTRTAPCSRPTTPPDTDAAPLAYSAPSMPSPDELRPYGRRSPHRRARSSSSLSSASEHYEDRVKAIKSGEGWVHDDALAPDILPPVSTPQFKGRFKVTVA